jgi:hypothetical protein
LDSGIDQGHELCEIEFESMKIESFEENSGNTRVFNNKLVGGGA